MFYQDKNKTLYKNSDYTARSAKHGDTIRFFIRFHGQVSDSPELEVDAETFLLYTREFNKPLEIQRNEWRRHIYWGELDEATVATRRQSGHAEDFEQSELWHDVEAILRTCTEIQQRRFRLHLQGYSLTEIARSERCAIVAVFYSVEAVRKKLKNIF